MVIPLDFHHYFHYFLRQDITKLYITIAIRNLAVGMVSIFSPAYIYLYFDASIPLTMLYFGLMYGVNGVLAVAGGRLIAALGSSKTMLISSFFLIGYYLSLFSFDRSFLFVPLSIIAAGVAMALFWPGFHTDFARFSSRKTRGKESGRINVAMLLPTILSPLLGGFILVQFGFPVLFIIVSVVLVAATIPLFYRRQYQETYTDSYTKAWSRMFKKENWRTSVGLLSESFELGVVHFHIWPLFLFIIAISFAQMGGIASFALIVSSLFMLYAGRISDTKERPWLLNVGSVWTAIAWILKFFVATPFSALLAQTIYRISRAAAMVPFQTFFYEKAAAKGSETDEFIVYREILVNLSRFVFFSALAAIFFLFPNLQIQSIFFIAAFVSLGLMFMGKFPLSLTIGKTQK